MRKQNEFMQQEMQALREELAAQHQIYEELTQSINQNKSSLGEYENRLHYANEVIQGLQTEGHQVKMDTAAAKAAIKTQERAYAELKT